MSLYIFFSDVYRMCFSFQSFFLLLGWDLIIDLIYFSYDL